MGADWSLQDWKVWWMTGSIFQIKLVFGNFGNSQRISVSRYESVLGVRQLGVVPRIIGRPAARTIFIGLIRTRSRIRIQEFEYPEKEKE